MIALYWLVVGLLAVVLVLVIGIIGRTWRRHRHRPRPAIQYITSGGYTRRIVHFSRPRAIVHTYDEDYPYGPSPFLKWDFDAELFKLDT